MTEACAIPKRWGDGTPAGVCGLLAPCPVHGHDNVRSTPQQLFDLLLALDTVEVRLKRVAVTALSDVYRLVATSCDAPGSPPVQGCLFDGKESARETAAGRAYLRLGSLDKAELWEFAVWRELRRGHFTGRGRGTP